MKLVLTLLARDEADIVDAQIAYHLNAGVDFVVATDHRSEDGTTEILEEYEREGYLYLIREVVPEMRQAEWVTRMARLAAEEFGAEWVVNSDADEFWCARGAPLKTILAEVPDRFGTVRALVRNFVPRPLGDEFFAERMTVRLAPGGQAPPSRLQDHPFHAQDKVIHRANPAVAVSHGNHEAGWEGSVDLRGWWPLEVLHFPIRSPEQCVRKWDNCREHYRDALPFEYDSLLLVDDVLAHGLSEGSLVEDNRLRDVLRALRSSPGEKRRPRGLRLPRGGPPLELPAHTLLDDAALAADVTAASERDSFVRAQRRLDELETRLSYLERRPASRFAHAARRVALAALRR